MDAVHLMESNMVSMIFAVLGFTFGRLGVPMFLFLTGYLLLARNYDDNDCKKFWKKNWLGMLITTEVWIVIYDVFLRVIHAQSWHTMGTIKDMLFMTQVHMGHMWYMPMIIGIYVCIPFISNALHAIRAKTLQFPVLVLSFYAFGIPVWQVVNKAMNFTDITSVLDFGFSGGVYGLYIILGFLLNKGILKKITTKCLVSATGFFYVLTVFLQIFSYSAGITYNVWYNCGLLLLCCLCLFELFSRFNCFYGQKAWTWISKNSFGMYLVHFPMIILLKEPLKNLPCAMPFKVLMMWVFVLGISIVICRGINYFPKLSRIVLYSR